MSNEFENCKTKVTNAKSCDDIREAVLNLDEKFLNDNNLVSEDDWAELTHLISTHTKRLRI